MLAAGVDDAVAAGGTGGACHATPTGLKDPDRMKSAAIARTIITDKGRHQGAMRRVFMPMTMSLAARVDLRDCAD
jgi:hypothetical protein